MKRITAWVLLLAALPAMAAVGDCEPKHQRNAAAPGSATVEFWNLDGAARTWWCPGVASPNAPAGSTWWKPARGDGGLYAYGWDAFKAAAPRVLAAADPWAQYKIESAGAAKSPPAGSIDECKFRALHHGACVALRTSALGSPYPAAITRAQALAADKCGPEPVCAAPPVWVVDAATGADGTRPAYPFVNGVRGTSSTARATSGQPCRPEVAQASSLTAGTVWAAFGPTFASGMVALCRKVP